MKKTEGSAPEVETDASKCGAAPDATKSCDPEECATVSYVWLETKESECGKDVDTGTCQKDVDVTCEETVTTMAGQETKEEVDESYCDELADTKPEVTPEECAVEVCQEIEYEFDTEEAEECAKVGDSCERAVTVVCMKSIDFGEFTEVTMNECSDLPADQKPDSNPIACNAMACATVSYVWDTDKSACATSSEGACQKQVTITCDMLVDGVFSDEAEDDDCVNNNAGVKPSSDPVDCAETACATDADTSLYTYAYKTEDGGVCALSGTDCEKPVTVTCERTTKADDAKETVALSLCQAADSGAGVQPSATATCAAELCVTYSWESTKAATCALSNGSCVKEVTLGCKASTGSSVDVSYCDVDTKPSDTPENCPSTDCDVVTFTWMENKGTCALDESVFPPVCTQTPVVTCIKTTNNVLATVDNQECIDDGRVLPTPAATNCNWEVCASYDWHTSEDAAASCGLDNAGDKCTKPDKVECHRTADTVTTADDETKCTDDKPTSSTDCEFTECQSSCGSCPNDPVCGTDQYLAADATQCCPNQKKCAQKTYKNAYTQNVNGLTIETCPNEIDNLRKAAQLASGAASLDDVAATCPTTSPGRRLLQSLAIDFEITANSEAAAFAMKDKITAPDFKDKVNGELQVLGSAATAESVEFTGLSSGEGGETKTYTYNSTEWVGCPVDPGCGADLTKTRTVTCNEGVDATGAVVDNNYCTGTTPASSENCGFAECTTIEETQAPDTLETSASTLCMFLCFVFMIFNY